MQLVEEWYKTEQVKFGASANAKSLNAAAERGNAYHRKVYKLLKMQLGIQPSLADWELLVEPWFRGRESRNICSPDSVLLNKKAGIALVVEVKLNYAQGKDEKLLLKYLPVVASAFGVKTLPCMVVQCLRGYREAEPLKGLAAIWQALDWKPGQPTPTTLVL